MITLIDIPKAHFCECAYEVSPCCDRALAELRVGMPKKQQQYTWKVTLLRSDGRPLGLGEVQAPDEKNAIKRVADQLDLSVEQKKRIVVQRMGQRG